MEFHSLRRSELQSLCKRNKIPANMTNIAMANALKSLEIVKGIEEFSQPKESESAQSSIESPAKSEVTSPYVPPTAGRTTCQRTIAKEEPQSLQTMTRTRGTARKTQAKNKAESRVDATETPAVAAQPSRRRVPVASACRKMESQLKECAEENEKKGVQLTPVALEVTSRRRGLKKESEVRRVYSTRQSARLAEKNVEILNAVKNEKSEILKSDLFMKEEGEKVEMNVKEETDGVPEVSEITGVDVETSLKECPEENEKKGVPLTPVAIEVTSWTRGLKKESEVMRVYSTRRSVRLAEKNVEILNEVKNEKSEILKSDLFMKEEGEKLEMNVKEDTDGVHEVSEIAGVDVETSFEENSKKMDGVEVSSGQKQNISDENDESKRERNVDEKLCQNSETDDPDPEMDRCIDAGEEQLSIHYETGLELNEERSDETEPSNCGNVAMTLNESNMEEKLSQNSETDDPNLEMDRCIYAGEEQLSIHYETGLELNEERSDETEPSNCGNVAMTLNESNVEEKLSQNFETDDPNLEMDQCIDAGVEQLTVLYETGSELDWERANETETSNGGNVPMTLIESNDFEDGDGSPDICSFESESEFEKTTELNTHKDADEADFKDTTDHGAENISTENIVEVKQDEGGEENVTNLTNDVNNGANQASEEEPVGKTLCHEIENLQIEGVQLAAEKVPENVLASINWQLYGSENAAVDSPLHLNANLLESNVEERKDEVGDENESTPTKDVECGVQKSSSRDEHSLKKNLCHEVENLPIEASEKAAADGPSSDAILNVLDSIKNSETQHLGGLESAATVHSPKLRQSADFLKVIETSGIEAEPDILIPPRFVVIDSSFMTQLKSLTPTKKSASKASATVKKIAEVSDNKENIGSCGSKLVLTKERVKIVKDIADNVDKNMDLRDLSVRKLSKMLKEKLLITNKSSKTENNGTKAITRPALQALPENTLGNETEN